MNLKSVRDEEFKSEVFALSFLTLPGLLAIVFVLFGCLACGPKFMNCALPGPPPPGTELTSCFMGSSGDMECVFLGPALDGRSCQIIARTHNCGPWTIIQECVPKPAEKK